MSAHRAVMFAGNDPLFHRMTATRFLLSGPAHTCIAPHMLCFYVRIICARHVLTYIVKKYNTSRSPSFLIFFPWTPSLSEDKQPKSSYHFWISYEQILKCLKPFFYILFTLINSNDLFVAKQLKGSFVHRSKIAPDQQRSLQERTQSNIGLRRETFILCLGLSGKQHSYFCQCPYAEMRPVFFLSHASIPHFEHVWICFSFTRIPILLSEVSIKLTSIC